MKGNKLSDSNIRKEDIDNITYVTKNKHVIDFSRYISNNGKFSTDVSMQPHSLMSREEIYQIYYRVLKKKVLGKDQKLMKSIIDNRTQQLQARSNYVVGLDDGKGTLAVINIYGVLPDHTPEIVDFWYGKKLAQEEYWEDGFSSLVREFKMIMQQHNVRDVSVAMSPVRTGTISKVRLNFSFA